MQGWPRIILQIQKADSIGRVSVIAHGFAHVPCTPGTHELTPVCWRATGSQEEELRAYFLDEYPVLLDEDLVYHKAPAYRHRLVTVASGMVSDSMHFSRNRILKMRLAALSHPGRYRSRPTS